jgi:hypothetical protein
MQSVPIRRHDTHRLKTLLDALRMPQNLDELSDDKPDEGALGCWCIVLFQVTCPR